MSWHDAPKHPFAGIAEKLKRADQNVLNLQSEIEGFIQSGKYQVIPNPQGQERQEALAYHRIKVIPRSVQDAVTRSAPFASETSVPISPSIPSLEADFQIGGYGRTVGRLGGNVLGFQAKRDCSRLKVDSTQPCAYWLKTPIHRIWPSSLWASAKGCRGKGVFRAGRLGSGRSREYRAVTEVLPASSRHRGSRGSCVRTRASAESISSTR
jgi:hypothetical protein